MCHLIGAVRRDGRGRARSWIRRLRHVFNFQGSELIIILLLALVVLGPEKLPEAMRRAGRFYADLKKMSSSFQEEFRAVVDEPMREMRETATALRDSADFTKLAEGQRAEKPKSAEMTDAPAAPSAPDASNGESSGGSAVPVPDLPSMPSEAPSSIDTDGFGSLPSVRRDRPAAEDETRADGSVADDEAAR